MALISSFRMFQTRGPKADIEAWTTYPGNIAFCTDVAEIAIAGIGHWVFIPLPEDAQRALEGMYPDDSFNWRSELKSQQLFWAEA